MSNIIFILFIAVIATLLSLFLSMKLSKNGEPKLILAGAVFVLVIAAGFLLATFRTVTQSTVAVVTTWGHVEDETLGEGPHLLNPVSKLHEVFIGLDVAKIEGAQAASKDLQSVHTDLTMNYHVDPLKARALYQLAPSLQYEALYIQPAMFEVFKAVAAHYTAEQLVTQRQAVSLAIVAGLKSKLESYGLLIQDINITNFKFSDSFDKAIEAKVTASQRADQSERELAQAGFDAQKVVAKAKGEAEAIAAQAIAIKAAGGAEYLQLQAINKWNGQLPTYVGAGAPLPFINAGK